MVTPGTPRVIDSPSSWKHPGMADFPRVSSRSDTTSMEWPGLGKSPGPRTLDSPSVCSRTPACTMIKRQSAVIKISTNNREQRGTPAPMKSQNGKVFSRTTKSEGREHLRKLLNWEEFDEVRDSRTSILLDTLYDSIIFAVGKGFPWTQVVSVVKFTEELLQETKGCSITEAIVILANKLRDYQEQLNITHLLALCDYFHNTFLRHYKLYQYVLGQDQDVNLTVTHLEVCPPPQPLPLSQGVDQDVWKHEQQVAELEALEAQKRANMLVLKEKLLLERDHKLQKMFSGASLQQHGVQRKEELEILVSDAIHIQTECLKELLQLETQTTFDILDLKLQKKTLNFNAPVPFPLSIMGPPCQDEMLKSTKVSKGKKGKAKK